MASVAAIVVAGGSSRRMGFDKLRADLGGKPVFLHCLETLQACEEIGQIVFVVSEANLAEFRGAVSGLSKVGAVIPGGCERHLSVAAGLRKVRAEFSWVAVHDAARPLLTQRDLLAVLAGAQKFGAASLAAPITDTLKRADASHCIIEAVNREQIWGMQTPQIFRTERLRAAYASLLASGEPATDDASAVAKMGDEVKLIPSQDFNFKITYSCDIDLARAALALAASGKK